MSIFQRPEGPLSTSTLKPLTRRPTLVRKRDDNEEAPPFSPGKRAKVTFDSDVEVRVAGDLEKAPELIQEEVRRAFMKRALGDNTGYDRLKEVYRKTKDVEDAFSPNTTRNYTIALLSNVSALNKTNSDLVQLILNSDWLGRQEEYVSLYVRLLANIVSAQGIFLGDLIGMLVQNLTAGTFRAALRLGNIY